MPSPRARRRFLTGLCLATGLLFVSGDERVRFDVIAELAPDGLSGTTLVADPERANALKVDLDEAVWQPLSRSARSAGDTLFAATAAQVSASDGHVSDHVRSALVTLDAWQDEQRVAWRVFGAVLADARGARGSGFMDVPERATGLSLRFHVRPGTGSFHFTAEPVRLMTGAPLYPAVLVVTGALWITLATVLLGCLWRRSGTLSSLGMLIGLAAVTIGVSVSEAAPFQAYRHVAEMMAALSAHVPGGRLGLFKGGHLFVFFALGVVAGLCRPALSAGYGQTVLALLLLACASESLQRHLVDRTALVADVFIDLTGALLGLALASAARAIQDTRDRPAR